MHAEFCLKYPPHWLSPPPQGGGSNPLEHLPVGADLLSCKKQAVNGGKKIFFATFLQAKKQAIDRLLYAWFFVNHRRSICPEVVANLEVSIFQNLSSLLVDFFSFVRMDISSFFLPCVGFYNLLDYPTTS